MAMFICLSMPLNSIEADLCYIFDILTFYMYTCWPLIRVGPKLANAGPRYRRGRVSDRPVLVSDKPVLAPGHRHVYRVCKIAGAVDVPGRHDGGLDAQRQEQVCRRCEQICRRRVESIGLNLIESNWMDK